MTQTGAWRTLTGTPFETQKKPVSGSRGVVAANNPIGAAAGLEMLAMGGNALDAAIATFFTLNVVEPMMVGLAGAGWMNIRLADGTSIIIDNYSIAPMAATPTMFKPLSDTWPDYMETEGKKNRVGHLAVGVPGALKGWAEVISNWGRLDLHTVMQPAIRHAEQGFRPSDYLRESILSERESLARFRDTARIFLPGGEPPGKNDLIVQPELAETLRTIAKEGPDVLYNGALGQAIADDVQKNGGLITTEDFKAYRTIRRKPITGTYRGYELTVPPPPCSGGTHILQILHLLEGFDISAFGFGTADMIHLLAECLKIAFADRTAYMGDPEQVDVPVEWLISSGYADLRRKEIDFKRAAFPGPGSPASAEPEYTTHVTAADSDGNIAAMTQTIHELFGSKVMASGTGLLLNDNMQMFDPHPGHPNSVAPGKRMVSSMSPTIVLEDGRPFMALGVPGGMKIFPAVTQAIVNVIDHGMTLQEAFEAPRVFTKGQELEVESAVPSSIRKELISRGHEVVEVVTVGGGMNGVMFSGDGSMTGAACWRADGGPTALGGGPAKPGVRFKPAL